jgi:hypothetical protein
LDGVGRALLAFPPTVNRPQEVRPMYAASKWVLPLGVTVGRLT